MPDPPPEPWLRGILLDWHPVNAHLLRASEQIREDLTRALAPLSDAEVWAKPGGMTSAGFHARHLAGSTDRLCTYLEGKQLSPPQLAELAAEQEGGISVPDLLAAVSAALDRYDLLIRDLSPEQFGDIREVGRKKIQTTAVGLAIHIAEHGQRHVGQAIGASKQITGPSRPNR